MSRRKVKLPVFWYGNSIDEKDFFKIINSNIEGIEPGELIINSLDNSLITMESAFPDINGSITGGTFIKFLDESATTRAIAAAASSAIAYTNILSANVVNTIIELSGNLVTYVGDVLESSGNTNCDDLKITFETFSGYVVGNYWSSAETSAFVETVISNLDIDDNAIAELSGSLISYVDDEIDTVNEDIIAFSGHVIGNYWSSAETSAFVETTISNLNIDDAIATLSGSLMSYVDDGIGTVNEDIIAFSGHVIDNYATSAAVHDTFAKYATSANTSTAIKAVQDNVDEEFNVIEGIISKFNESCGFDYQGNSILTNNESLTSAIIKKVNITDRINSAHTAYSATTADNAIKDGNGDNIASTYLTISHANASGTSATTGFGHVRLVKGDVSGVTYADGVAAAAAHSHSNYAASSHVYTSGTSNNFGHVKLVSGELSGKTSAVNGEAAASYHKHSNYSTTGHTHSGDEIINGTISTAVTVTKAISATTANSATTIKVTNVTTGTRYLVGVSSNYATAGASLDVYNGVYMNGNNLYATSDERLKNFIDDIKIDFDALKTIPKKYFYWKDIENRGSAKELGTSAQKLMKVYPEIVTTDNNGNLGVSYERLSIIALAAIDKLYEENKQLKERLEKIEKLLNIK